MAASNLTSRRFTELDSDDEYSPHNPHPLYRDEFMKNRPVNLPQQLYTAPEDVKVKKYIGNGVALVSLVTENLLSHPFQVLRRQCQVNHTAQKFHIVPVTLLPTIYHLHQHQGVTTLWKGLGSVLLVRGISLGVEDLISKTTPWPKEICWDSSLKEFVHHMLLKCVSLAICTPFYCASFVETVQSDIASEKPRMFDVFREGFIRLLNWNGGYKGRMLPIWVLVVPTVTLGLAKYLFSLLIKGATVRLLHAKYRHKYEINGTLPKDLSNKAIMQDLDVTANIVANIASDVAFYPCETIIYRLYLQGTRTIVDNLDSGRAVLPILTNYVGATDCYDTCIASEGKFGLYKGFGALILQYTVHIALIQFSRFFFTEIGQLFRKSRSTNDSSKPPRFNNSAITSPAAVSNLSVPHRSYLLP